MVGHYFFKIVEALFLDRGLSQDRGHFSTKPSLFIFVVVLFSIMVVLFKDRPHFHSHTFTSYYFARLFLRSRTPIFSILSIKAPSLFIKKYNDTPYKAQGTLPTPLILSYKLYIKYITIKNSPPHLLTLHSYSISNSIINI